MKKDIGKIMYSWAEDLFPICRSITGPGVRETLLYLKELLPNLKIYDVPTGEKVFDWVVPNEWFIKDAYIEDSHGNKIVDFRSNNLHVVGYSKPIDKWMDLSVLNNNLYSLPDEPNAIPYVTSYYNESWGFCLTHSQRELLQEGLYHVVIDSELKPGVLNYGEIIIKGETDKEVLLSTYICHPSMANNELSGPIVTTGIAQWINSLHNPRYTYRIIFIPETIGSIVYLSKHSSHMKAHTVAGLVLTCIGDDRDYSLLPSRCGDTLIDKVASYALNHYVSSFSQYSYLDRGSDERQFCSPGIDLPVCSVMRTKYGMYPEYHTSLDDLTLISPEGLKGGFEIIKKIIKILEFNKVYKNNILCEPQLGRRNLYPSLSIKENDKYDYSSILLDILSYTDGSNDLVDIAKKINVDFFVVNEAIKDLCGHDIVCVA